MRTKKITTVALLIALYVILSGTIRIPVINHIVLDLGYVVFSVAIMNLDLTGAICVGCISVLIESLLFAFSGVSITWMISNLVLAIIGHYFYTLSVKFKNDWIYIIGLLIGCIVAFPIVKTCLDSLIYAIPFVAKLIRNLVACLVDFISLVIGYFIGKKFLNKI